MPIEVFIIALCVLRGVEVILRRLLMHTWLRSVGGVGVGMMGALFGSGIGLYDQVDAHRQ